MRSVRPGHLGLAVLAFVLAAGPALAAQGLSIRTQDGQQVGLYQESLALVIGMSNYTAGWPSLPGVRQDVAAVKELLERHGFQVTLVEDLDRARLDQAIADFISRYGLRPENRLLFYYSGHGFTYRQAYGGEMGYIIPADTPNPHRDLTGFLSKAVDMQQIEVYARRIQAKHALFLFDSCFSGSIFALSRAASEAITYKTANPVRQFITSGSAAEEVPDRSVFRDQFVAALEGEGDLNRDGFVTGAELGEFLQTKVVNYSRGSQHPQYGKIRDPRLDKGDFVFALNPETSALTGESRRLEEERAKLEEERRRLAEARRLLEEQRKLAQERTGLEAERRRLEAEARPPKPAKGPAGPSTAELLRAAEADLAANRLTSPQGMNALEKYRQVLGLEPGNREAEAGLKRLVGRYVELAEAALKAGALDKAGEYLNRADQVIEGDQRVLEARAELRQARQGGATPPPPTTSAQAPQAQPEPRAAAAAPPADQEAGRKHLVNSLGMKFVLIPAGSYLMGSSDADLRRVKEDYRRATGSELNPKMERSLRFREQPQHKVTITRPFYLGVHEVTVGQFARFVEETGYRTAAEKEGKVRALKNGQWVEIKGASWRDPKSDGSGPSGRLDHPVVQVTWADALAFVDWLNRKEGAGRYRLPSEAEWEYACRGGREGELYPWGGELPGEKRVANLRDRTLAQKWGREDFCRDYDDGHLETAPVGSFEANGYGLFDMIGNVLEWCADWFKNYSADPAADPTGPPDGERRVARGGAWNTWFFFDRSAFRVSFEPGYCASNLGFRVARTY